MIPILFEHDATTFTTHGLGDLIDCGECKSKVTAEGEYELSFTYPMNSELFPELRINRIVYAKVDDHGNYQAFRIYGYEKGINGMMTINCQHISYDMTGIPVYDFKDCRTCESALTSLKNNAAVACPFTFHVYNIDDPPYTQDGTFAVEEPDSMRAILLDGDDSIKGVWGGDLVFDNFDVHLYATAGEDRGIVLEYGIDIVDFTQEENISEMITGVLPYWKGRGENDSEDHVVCGSVRYAEGTFERQRIEKLNLGEYFENPPTPDQLDRKADEWMAAEKIGEPELSLTVNYAKLGQDVRLHDAVTVRFVKMGVETHAKVSSYTYDVLAERCIEVEVANAKSSSMWKGLEDASRLKRGLLPPKRIASNSISSDKIAGGAVTGSKIGGGAVGSSKIQSGAVTEEKIDDEAVTFSKIGNGAVGTVKIQTEAISSDKIANLAVTGQKIAEEAVSRAKLDGEIDNFITDTLIAMDIYSAVVWADYTVHCSVAHIGSHLVVNGTIYRPMSQTIYDHVRNESSLTYSTNSNNYTFNENGHNHRFIRYNYSLNNGSIYAYRTMHVNGLLADFSVI